MMNPLSEYRFPALEIRQGPGRTIYSFAVDGKLLPHFTTVSRVRRAEDNELQGYQRPEVRSHISEIRTYLESEAPMLPNAIVVAFNKGVRFEPSQVQNLGPSYVRNGVIVIEVQADQDDWQKPGWIVDGQQRVAAVREAMVEQFPICVTAFITADDREQREQFILVNSTKPLPKGLIYELLPTTDARLPAILQRRRFPALLSERLNHDSDSPMFNRIQTPTSPEGIIKDNSILKMIENSLADGALYRFRSHRGEETDMERMLIILKNFWWAVAEVFPEAWGQSPRRSRLMHGAGIVSLGYLMDAIADRYRDHEVPTKEQFAKDLRPLADGCSWTSGWWHLGLGVQRKWNELQNTSKDIQLLTNYLLVNYREKVWNRHVPREAAG